MKRGAPLQRKTRLRPRSPKREEYLASPEREEGKAHMARVAQLPCLVCGDWPVEVHHDPDPRDDMRTMPICPRHHRREYGTQALHSARRAFHERHGSPEEMLARVDAMLKEMRGVDQ